MFLLRNTIIFRKNVRLKKNSNKNISFEGSVGKADDAHREVLMPEQTITSTSVN